MAHVFSSEEEELTGKCREETLCQEDTVETKAPTRQEEQPHQKPVLLTP